MNDLLTRLRPKERGGSKPRCHLLTHGPADVCTARLTSLATPFAVISADDDWMPRGFNATEEAQLHRAASLLEPRICQSLAQWWLAPASRRARTPNFDIASTCNIDGRRGLLLVEAKGHDEELNKEATGRLLESGKDDEDRRASHDKIADAIESARVGLSEATALSWGISRDSRYQMSNRFAWAWKLTTLGIPVALVYLGFLNAAEMTDRGAPFATHADWEQLVLSHSRALFPASVWNRRWTVNGQALIPLVRSIEVRLDQTIGSET